MSESASSSESELKEELDGWEIHLVYNVFHEADCDESLAIAAPDRETAIEEARRVSRNNPPEVGPTYNEGDKIPVEACENWPSYMDERGEA